MGGRSEAEIQADVWVRLGGRPDIRLWRMNTGRASDRQGRSVQFGTPGQPDLMGVLRLPNGIGVWLGVEVKTATGRQSELQQRYQAIIEAMGGCYILARSADEAETEVTRWTARAGGCIIGNPST